MDSNVGFGCRSLWSEALLPPWGSEKSNLCTVTPWGQFESRQWWSHRFDNIRRYLVHSTLYVGSAWLSSTFRWHQYLNSWTIWLHDWKTWLKDLPKSTEVFMKTVGNCVSKVLHFLQIMTKHWDCLRYTVFPTIKTSSQNISIMLLQILLKRHEHRGGYWRIKLLWTILEEQFLVPRVCCYDNSDVIATVIIKNI